MSVFRVGLKKIVDDSYDIEIGTGLAAALVKDLKNGLVPGVSRYAVVTDSNVAPLYGEAICQGARGGPFGRIVHHSGRGTKQGSRREGTT